MSRTGENIYKRKDGRWEGRYIKTYLVNGKARYGYVYARSYGETKIKLSNAISLSQKQAVHPSALFLFSEISQAWLQRVKRDCKASTYNKYRNTLEKIINPYFGDIPLAKIGAESVDNFLGILLSNGKVNKTAYSKKSVQEICMEMKQIFRFAEENYQVFAQFPLKKLHIKNEQKEINPLNQSEMCRLTDFLLDKTDKNKLGVLISLYTGIRLGELCALQWKDISFDCKTMVINKSIGRIQQLDNPHVKTKLIVSTPKSPSSNRIIPIPDFLSDILKKLYSDGNYYIISDDCSYPDPTALEKTFRKMLVRCSIRPVTFHTLRHTFATRCIELGFDVKTLSEILGHSSVNITLNRYVHSSMEQKRKSMNLLTVERYSPSEK